MNAIAKFLAVSACAIGIASPLASFAQAAMDHSKMESAQAPAMTDGEIKKVDQATGKVTIKHGEIRNLDMPAMTMVFRVSDPAMLQKVKTGDKVRFKADKVGGQITLVEVEVAR